MTTSLISGILAALLAGFVELAASLVSDIAPTSAGNGQDVAVPVLALLIFSFIEEGVKFATLRALLRNWGVVSSPLALFLFGAGFGGTEVFIAQAMFPDLPVSAFFGIPALHLATVFLYGYTLSQNCAKSLGVAALIAGTALHFFYNIFLA